jgi:hypothetical protein
VLTALDAVRASSYLLVNDMQKYEGAAAANDTTYMAIYVQRYETDLSAFQTSMFNLKIALQSLQAQLQSDPTTDMPATLQEIDALQTALASLGLPSDVLDQLNAAGFMNTLTSPELDSLTFNTDFSSYPLLSPLDALDDLNAVYSGDLSDINLAVLPGETATTTTPEPPAIGVLLFGLAALSLARQCRRPRALLL